MDCKEILSAFRGKFLGPNALSLIASLYLEKNSIIESKVAFKIQGVQGQIDIL